MTQEHIIQLNKAVEAVKAKENVNHIYFVACGGSQALMMPAQFTLDREIDIPASVYSSNDFVHRQPKALGENSVVITCSHSGNTPETIEATKVARAKGALTIALSHLEGSALWEAAEYPIHYSWGPEADASDINRGVICALSFHIMNTLRPCEKFERAIACMEHFNEVIVKAKAQFEPIGKEWGKKYKREKFIYTMGSGACYGEAYAFAICMLMEMQWINASAIHSGEYFHGPFEITDFDVPFVILKGLGSTRPLDDRAHNFCQKYSEKIMLVDAATFDLTGIDEDIKEYIVPYIMPTVLRTFSDALAYERGHLLSVRRYMWKMEY